MAGASPATRSRSRSGQVRPLEGLVALRRRSAPCVKHRHSALVGTPLLPWLREQGVGRLIVAGIRTEQCCETTTRHASDEGFEVDYVAEATLTFDMKTPDGAPLSAAEIRERDGDGAGRPLRHARRCRAGAGPGNLGSSRADSEPLQLGSAGCCAGEADAQPPRSARRGDVGIVVIDEDQFMRRHAESARRRARRWPGRASIRCTRDEKTPSSNQRREAHGCAPGAPRKAPACSKGSTACTTAFAKTAQQRNAVVDRAEFRRHGLDHGLHLRGVQARCARRSARPATRHRSSRGRSRPSRRRSPGRTTPAISRRHPRRVTRAGSTRASNAAGRQRKSTPPKSQTTFTLFRRASAARPSRRPARRVARARRGSRSWPAPCRARRPIGRSC